MPDRLEPGAEILTACAASGHRPSTLRFYGDEFVFDTVSGMFFRLSPAASFILHRLDAGASLEDLAGAVQTRYGVDRATASRDVELFLNELAALEPLDHFTHGERRSE